MFGYGTVVIAFYLCVASVDSEQVSYHGHSLISVKINSVTEVQWLQGLADEQSYNRKIDIWSYPTKANPYLHVLVAPDFRHVLQTLLSKRGLYYHTAIGTVDNAIAGSRRRRHAKPRHHSINFPVDDYHTFEEISTSLLHPVPKRNATFQIERWLRKLNTTRPLSFRLSSLGETAEGRNIWLAKIGSTHLANGPKPAIFIDAGMHAREWISHATALYFIKRLMHHQRSNDQESAIWKSIDWYIVPVANPDGYVYSMTTDRLWRKTRSTSVRNHPCKGVDINRNFDFHFGEAGANTNYPCSNVYAGSYPFSEVETDSVAKKLRQLTPALKVYISLHSYGQLWLVPWGYSEDRPDNYQRQNALAQKAMAALREINQTKYSFGTIADLMYPASGTSVDYAHSLGIPFSLALELRPEDSDTTFGFLYPPEYIPPTARETWEALKIIAKEVQMNTG